MSAPNASASASQLPAVPSQGESQSTPRPRIPVRLASGELAEWTGDDHPQLSENQIRALQVLSNGFGVADAADAAGVSRATVYRWLSRDPAVRAIYSRWKRLCFESAQSRLVALQNAAVDVLAEEVENKHNPKIAAMILDKMRVMRPAPLGADTPAAASKEIEVEVGERNLTLAERADHVRRRTGDLTSPDLVKEKTPEPTAASPALDQSPAPPATRPAGAAADRRISNLRRLRDLGITSDRLDYRDVYDRRDVVSRPVTRVFRTRANGVHLVTCLRLTSAVQVVVGYD